MPEPTYIDQGATFSPDRAYRYLLWRAWAPGPRVLFVMLNPSTADETKLDPTLRRCLGFAQRWGFGGFEIANMFAFRSTKPLGLVAAADPIGPENGRHLVEAARRAPLVIAGWGAHGCLFDREAQVLELLAPVTPLHALVLTQSGHPGHPLYLAGDAERFLWRERGAA